MIVIGEVVHHDDETMLGFFSRVASDHQMSLRQFCEYKGTTAERLSSANRTAVERVTEQWKTDPSEVIARMPVRKGAFYWRGSEHNLHRRGDRLAIRYCPGCVAADLSSAIGKPRTRPYQRNTWLSPYVFQCVDHGLDLVTLDHDYAASVPGDFASAIFSLLKHLDAGGSVLSPGANDPVSHYFTARENGVTDEGGVLDTMVTFAAAEICEAFGCLALDQEAADLREKLNRGFAILSAGDDEIIRFLDGRLHAPFAGRRRSVTDIYGAVYRLLRNNTGSNEHYAPVRDIVVSHGLENLPLGKGESFLGRTATTRKYHTVHSAALEYGMSDRHVASLLERHGALSATDDYSGARFEVSIIDKALDNHAGARVSLAELKARAGMTTSMIAKLVEIGALVRRGPTSKSEFRASDVDTFLGSIFGKLCRGSPRGAVSIGAATKMTAVPKHEIIVAIADGRITGYSGRSGVRLVDDIKVGLADIKSWGQSTSEPSTDRLSVRKTVERMRVGEPTMEYLLESGYLTFAQGPGRTRYILIKAADEFMRRHIPLSEIQRLTGRKMATLRAWLSDHGLSPTIEGGDGKAGTFYARGDVMAIVAQNIAPECIR